MPTIEIASPVPAGSSYATASREAARCTVTLRVDVMHAVEHRGQPHLVVVGEERRVDGAGGNRPRAMVGVELPLGT